MQESFKTTTKENIVEKPKIKEGVDFVFEQNSELSQIGTKEQYSEYLDIIFLNSKVKDIVYHGTAGEFDLFTRKDTNYNNDILTGQLGYYFTHSFKAADIYRTVSSKSLSDIQPTAELVKKFYHGEAGKIIPVVLNFINPKIYNTFIEFSDDLELNSNNILKNDHDSIIVKTDSTGTDELIALQSEQIHMLGSKQDIEKFKEFVSNYKTK